MRCMPPPPSPLPLPIAPRRGSCLTAGALVAGAHVCGRRPDRGVGGRVRSSRAGCRILRRGRLAFQSLGHTVRGGGGGGGGGRGGQPRGARGGRTGCRAAASVSKAHGAGVCALASHPSDPYTLLTGSYDERIRVCCCSGPEGGGRWDFERWWGPRADTVAVACRCGTRGVSRSPRGPRKLAAACGG